MRTIRLGLVALLAVALFAIPAVAAKPVKPPEVPAAPTIVDVNDNIVGTLIDTQYGTTLIYVGTARFFVELAPSGFQAPAAYLYYTGPNCTGEVFINLTLWTPSWFLPRLYVNGTTGYYTVTTQNVTTESFIEYNEAVCHNYTSTQTLGPAQSVDLSGFNPPFRIK